MKSMEALSCFLCAIRVITWVADEAIVRSFCGKLNTKTEKSKNKSAFLRNSLEFVN